MIPSRFTSIATAFISCANLRPRSLVMPSTRSSTRLTAKRSTTKLPLNHPSDQEQGNLQVVKKEKITHEVKTDVSRSKKVKGKKTVSVALKQETKGAICSCEDKQAEEMDKAITVKKKKGKGGRKFDNTDPSNFVKYEDNCKRRMSENQRWPGAHVSGAGGLQNAIYNALCIGANSFALFLKSQRKWTSPPLSQEVIVAFRNAMEEHGYTADHILPHGSYLINLANPDAEKRKKAFDCFLEDLQRCEKLGIRLYNFHPGSTVGACTVDESIAHLSSEMNKAIAATSSVICVVENMAGQKNSIGSRFEHLAAIISGIDDKSRVGICLDTCHLYAAGYDIRTPEALANVIQEFDDIVGLSYLKAWHLNDSKGDLGSGLDRHEKLGKGHLGLAPFECLMKDPRFSNMPIILETPIETDIDYRSEIEFLQKHAHAGCKVSIFVE